MAGQAKPGTDIEVPSLGARVPPPNTAPMLSGPERDAVREVAAKLYGQGIPRAKIARMMVDHLVPNGRDRPLEQRLSQARNKLRNWERDDKFRDLIYNLAVVKLDLQTPQILGGVGRKAKAGRVDAARLALELTGRHNPKGDSTPAQVIIAFNGVPRPHGSPQAVEASEVVVIDGTDAMVEEDEQV